MARVHNTTWPDFPRDRFPGVRREGIQYDGAVGEIKVTWLVGGKEKTNQEKEKDYGGLPRNGEGKLRYLLHMSLEISHLIHRQVSVWFILKC